MGSRRVAWSLGAVLRSIDTLAAAQVYDDAGRSLGSPAGVAPSPRQSFIYCVHERYLLIWGGHTEVRALVDGAVLDVQEPRWRPVSSRGAPSLRASPVLACRGRRLVVLGGGSIDRPGTNLDGGFVYDLVADRWTPIPGVPQLNACTPVLPVDRGPIIIGAAFGSGCGAEPPRVLGIVDAVAARWTAIPFPPAPINQAWAWTGSRLLVFGGEPPVINPCSRLRPPHPGCDPAPPPRHYVMQGYAFAPAVGPAGHRAPHRLEKERRVP